MIKCALFIWNQLTKLEFFCNILKEFALFFYFRDPLIKLAFFAIIWLKKGIFTVIRWREVDDFSANIGEIRFSPWFLEEERVLFLWSFDKIDNFMKNRQISCFFPLSVYSICVFFFAFFFQFFWRNLYGFLWDSLTELAFSSADEWQN